MIARQEKKYKYISRRKELFLGQIVYYFYYNKIENIGILCDIKNEQYRFKWTTNYRGSIYYPFWNLFENNFYRILK